MDGYHQSDRVDSKLGLGTTLESVSESLLYSYNSAPTKCMSCINPAKYQLIPKRAELDTYLLQTQGYVCEYCVNLGGISPSDYGLRDMYPEPTINGTKERR
ncbi:hypothetical protein EalM132_00171 [Exiguobacterium phage vB_EalM-132]|nr:hypothetical protein EalM132_00001 [Exiguobacterium phage vB_EalM-132]AYP68683.1 hypothetical protein EalM132_00171 [Exiguobacterium phage vB_EalM-132]